MQVNVDVEKLGALAEHVFYDQRERVLYIATQDLYKYSQFISWLKDVERRFKSAGQTLQIKEDLQKVRERSVETTHAYAGDEEALKELTDLLNMAARQRVSDIHIVNDLARGCSVSFRIDSFLKKVRLYSYTEGHRIIRAAYSNSESPSETTYGQQLYQSGQLTKRQILPADVEAVRLQRGPLSNGEFAVLRILYRKTHIGIERGKDFEETLYKSLDRYGYSAWTIERVRRVVQGAEGLTIISGPTGSGKSTALKLMLELIHILYPYKSIFTIEDPPEYIIEGAKQLPVPSSSRFEQVLKVALRSDPDIIMVGEVRESETANTVINAVLTGHQVFTTLHAKDVPTIIARLGKLGVDMQEVLENDVVKLLISQRLIPRNCPKCARPVKFKGNVFYHSSGCPECGNTGVKGRAVVEESVSLEDLKYVGWNGLESLKSLKEYLRERGQDLLGQALLKALKGEVSPYMVQGYVEYFSEEDVVRVERALGSSHKVA